MNKLPPTAIRAAAPDVRGLRVPERTLQLLRDLIEQQAGIHYDDTRLDMLRDKVAPLAIDRGFDSLLDYYYLLKYDSAAAAEWLRLMDVLSVQETYFWRESDQLNALATAILPRLATNRRGAAIRIWSIPCATGEEPLSIAMALEDAGWFDRAAIEIHAGDVSDAALERARRARYTRRAFRQLGDTMRERHFTHDRDRDEWVVKPSIFKRVNTWSRVNIVQPAETALLAGADVIFCRNLFIYFTPPRVRDVAARLQNLMASPGFLCIGASESLLRSGAGFELQDLGGAYVYVKP